MNKREFGFQLESFACTQLKKSQCLIVENNFQCKLGEIDIIARDGQTLIFVEVRYRKQSSYGGAVASVDLRKQKKIIQTASFYLQQKKLTNKVSCRFDVFAIEGSAERLSYNWIKNAFTA
ncbi:YraN family protein [Aliikangiella coralliicola]|uniref:YraN family protein n=1 Tax=Aliikangiella coralliicola TaxID=2592383 RepID=UPI00143D3B3C|nr:YraN family protein [Aliikangiella coralliicola]